MAKIGIDIDDVLASLFPKILDFYNKKYKSKVQLEELSEFDFRKIWGGTRKQHVDNFYEFYKTKKFDEIPPIKDALKNIKNLSKQHDLVLITARPLDIKEKTEIWITKHFPNYFDKIHFTNQWGKNNLDKRTNKLEICRKEKIDILIEDSLEYANLSAPYCKKVILLNMPWNKKGEIADNIVRAKDWNEIYFLLTQPI